MEEKLTLTREWDKTFPQSGKVEHRKVTFHNRYGITLAADLYQPKGASGRLAAIPDAVHTDLYDGGGKDAIPFDKLKSFFRANLR